MSGKDWQNWGSSATGTHLALYSILDQWRYDCNQADYNTVPKNELSSTAFCRPMVVKVSKKWLDAVLSTIQQKATLIL